MDRGVVRGRDVGRLGLPALVTLLAGHAAGSNGGGQLKGGPAASLGFFEGKGGKEGF